MLLRLSPKEASKYLADQGVSFTEGSLAVMRCRGRGPRFHKLNRRVFYLQKDIDDYLSTAAQVVETVDTYQAGGAQ